jgi:TldD protein
MGNPPVRSDSNGDSLFVRTGLDPARLERLVAESLAGADDGELFLEIRQSESFAYDDGRLKSASFDSSRGFGLRAIYGEATGYAHSTDISEAAIRRAGETVQAVRSGHSGRYEEAPASTNQRLYTDENPLAQTEFERKLGLLADVDSYLRGRDAKVRQVMVSLAGNWQNLEILRADGSQAGDIRPLVRLNITVVAEKGGRMESGTWGTGGRYGYQSLLDPQTWQAAANEALRQAVVNLDSVPAPAGEMPVILGPGWPGILLHEAIGHGLEGDFNRKKTSAFSGLLGSRVAAPGVTVIDDGTIPDRRGSITIDDEGTPSQSTTLIEDGVLVGYIQDRLNARLMKAAPTGNGRRQSYAHLPIPRMTNTYMRAGDHDPAEILRSVKRGLYAVSFGGGQVDITSGKFVFSATEAYLIEDGKLGAPVKGASIIGNGPDVLTRIKMIGSNLELDAGIGTCGKDGQQVPVGVGLPTILIDSLTVGGMET